MIQLKAFPRNIVLHVIPVICMCGCGNPDKNDLLILAPVLFVSLTVISCLSEYSGKMKLGYILTFILSIINMVVIFGIEAGNSIFYFSIALQSMIIYTSIIHMIIKQVFRARGEIKKTAISPIISSVIVTLLFVCVIIVNGKPSGEIGDMTICIFGWPAFIMVSLVSG